MLGEVHKLLRLCLAVPITTTTSERSYSTLHRILTYMQLAMIEQGLNNCMLLHIHKAITDELCRFKGNSYMDQQRYFGNFDIVLQ